MNKQSKILLTSFLILIFLIVCGCTKQKVPVYEDNTLSIKLPDEWSWGWGYWGPGTEIFTIRNPKGILPSATVSVASLKVVKDDRPELLIEHAYNSNGVVDHIATQVFRSGTLAGISIILTLVMEALPTASRRFGWTIVAKHTYSVSEPLIILNMKIPLNKYSTAFTLK